MKTHLKEMMLGWLSFRRLRMSVSLMSRTFLTATSSANSLPRKTAPWAPLPSHWRSVILSNGISQSSEHTHTHTHPNTHNIRHKADWYQQKKAIYRNRFVQQSNSEIWNCPLQLFAQPLSHVSQTRGKCNFPTVIMQLNFQCSCP